MQNLENLDIFEILITQKLLKCPKDPFLRSALIYILANIPGKSMNKNNPEAVLKILVMVLACAARVREPHAIHDKILLKHFSAYEYIYCTHWKHFFFNCAANLKMNLIHQKHRHQ